MTDQESGFSPSGHQAFKTIFGEGFRPPFPRLPESTEAANPRRIAQRSLLGNDVIDNRDRALAIFVVMTTLGFKNECKLYMQGMRNLGYSVRQIGEILGGNAVRLLGLAE